MDSLVVYFLLLSCASVFAQDADNAPCAGEQIKNSAGECVDPVISRNIYVFAEPEKPVDPKAPVDTSPPTPKLEYNIVFVRAPERGEGNKPIVIPPPQQKTIVYVLSKKGENTEPKIIEIPAPPKQKPEVYYVNYAEGENPELPGGVDLQTALETAAEPAEPISAPGTPAAPGTPTAPGTPAAPSSTEAPVVYTPQAPPQTQQPQYIYLSPQQQGGLGNYQQLGFPAQQG